MKIDKVSQEFAKDLIELVNSLKGITYNAKVSYGKTVFEYVTLDKIYLHVKNNPNFAVLEPLGTNENGQSALQVILIHKSGEAITSDYYLLRVPENLKKQDEGAAITYTKRYALGSFLGVCTDQDNDANPEGKGMELGEKPTTEEPKNEKPKNEKPKNEKPPRDRLIEVLHDKQMNVGEFAKQYNVTASTTPERFEELIEIARGM